MKRIIRLLAGLTGCLLLAACAPQAAPEPDGEATPQQPSVETLAGSATGHNDEISVEVTLTDGVITDVKVVSHGETAGISDPALERVPKEIVAKNSAEVDAVSGATATSEGIMAAVKAALSGGAGETGGAGYPSKEAALPFEYSKSERNAASGIENAPRVKTLENGVRVQAVPSDEIGWNNVYLDADNRGCNACHELEDAITQMETFHGVMYMKYATKLTLGTCVACHSFYKTPLRDTIHATHMGSANFHALNGSCQSCHYIDGDGNYLRWDSVKYDHLRGITDIAAQDVNAEITYSQDVITPVENMYYKWLKNEPADWLTDDSQIVPEIMEQWEITVRGDMDNPFTMKLTDLVEKFGTVTQVMSSQCCINGVGDSMIFQSEVTGVPLERIFEYAQVHDDVTTFDAIAFDTYGSGKNSYPMNYDFVIQNKALLVIEVNGQPLPASQGYPCATWVYNASSGNNVKQVTELVVTKQENPAHWALVGDFIDPSTGEVFSKPNMGVLTAANGQIFKLGEEIVLEGYADAWDEPIVLMEFSFDHGSTWIRVETPNNDSGRWTYWTMKFSPEEAGAYLLRMRATSMTMDGRERVANINTDFLINVE